MRQWSYINKMPFVVNFYAPFSGLPRLHAYGLSGSDLCPESHFECPGTRHCLPIYVRCNGVYDCPGRQDEAACDSYTCPGFYRCRGSKICLHPDHVCDGSNHCPQQDDEWFCAHSCPADCSCQGLSFTCRRVFPVERYSDVRFLQAGSSGLTPARLFNNTMLIYLSLEQCDLTSLDLPTLPNLNIMDVSYNDIQVVTLEHLDKVRNLKTLLLTGNPLASFFTSATPSSSTFLKLRTIDLSMVKIPYLKTTVFAPFPGLTTLNLSGSATQRVSGGGFQNAELRELDMRGCDMDEFPQNMLKNLSSLNALYADNYKLCCPQSLPGGFNAKDCHAPSSVIASCDNLLGSNLHRIMVSFLAAATLLGNWTHGVMALWRGTNKGSSNVLMSHLCLSKSVMGAYLAAIGIANQLYSGAYLWKDRAWRSSPWCSACGFLFLLSSQVSVFLVAGMTLERCVALAGASRAAHWERKLTRLIALLSWVAGVSLAAVPAAAGWKDFSRTSLCIPLPLPQDRTAGHRYAFGVLVVLNAALMLLAAAGQVYVHVTVRSNVLAFLVDDQRARDLTAARRVISVAVTDVCCWCLVALWALLTARGAFVPGDVGFTTAVWFVLISAALAPYIHRLSVVMERRRQTQKQRLLKRLRYRLTAKQDRHDAK